MGERCGVVIALGSLSRAMCMTISQAGAQVVAHKPISISIKRNTEGWENIAYSDT